MRENISLQGYQIKYNDNTLTSKKPFKSIDISTVKKVEVYK